MDAAIKRSADNRDIKALKYIFVDSLDVDPTFIDYAEDYAYCKSVPGFIELHTELTPLTDDQGKWTEEYWTKLKMDLLKNFSEERFSHMQKVAKVIMAEKVKRLTAEREKAAQAKAAAAKTEHHQAQQPKATAAASQNMPSSAEQKRMLEEQCRKLAQQNREVEMRQAQQAERVEKAKQEKSKAGTGASSKKVMGVVLVVTAVVILAIILLLILAQQGDPKLS